MTGGAPRLDVRLLDRGEVGTLDPAAWDRLSDVSVAANPFYERWSLVPALRHFEKSERVYVVAAYDAGRLVALFPVVIKRKAWLLRYVAVWQFPSCLSTDVLIEPGHPLSEVADAIMMKLKVSIMISPTHGSSGFDVTPASNFCQISRERKAVTRFSTWEEYLARLPGKHRRETKRVIARLFEEEGARYVASDVDLRSKWYPAYLDVEQDSWKKAAGKTISSDPDKTKYFEEAIQSGEQMGKVEFQALLNDDEVLAISFRFKGQLKACEVKTSYREKYKKLYPGVVLESLNIKHISEEDYTIVDSCSFGNEVVERIWPDKIAVSRTTLFKKDAIGRLARFFYQGFKRLGFISSVGKMACR